MSDLLALRTTLLDAAERLATEYREYPQGSVIRCFAREVARARRRGVQPGQLAAVAEARTRVTLVRRRDPGRSHLATAPLATEAC